MQILTCTEKEGVSLFRTNYIMSSNATQWLWCCRLGGGFYQLLALVTSLALSQNYIIAKEVDERFAFLIISSTVGFKGYNEPGEPYSPINQYSVHMGIAF